MKDYRKKYKKYKSLYRQFSGTLQEDKQLQTNQYTFKQLILENIDSSNLNLKPFVENNESHVLEKAIDNYSKILNSNQLENLIAKLDIFRINSDNIKLKREVEQLIKSAIKEGLTLENKVLLSSLKQKQNTLINRIINNISNYNYNLRPYIVDDTKPLPDNILQYLTDSTTELEETEIESINNNLDIFNNESDNIHLKDMIEKVILSLLENGVLIENERIDSKVRNKHDIHTSNEKRPRKAVFKYNISEALEGMK